MSDVVIANGARSALEGMACSRPIVSVGSNGFCGVFQQRSIESFRRFNFDKGRLSGNPLGSREHLVAAAVRLLNDKRLRQRLGDFSREYAEAELIVQEAAARYEAWYEQAIQDPWGGATGRLKVGRRWLDAVVRYYAYRIGRRFQRDTPVPGSTLAPPPAGLDPDWESGLLEASAE